MDVLEVLSGCPDELGPELNDHSTAGESNPLPSCRNQLALVQETSKQSAQDDTHVCHSDSLNRIAMPINSASLL
jgi:hypothetical protein